MIDNDQSAPETPSSGHTTSIETERMTTAGLAVREPRYRWSCTCSPSARGRWVWRRFQAAQGASMHARRCK